MGKGERKRGTREKKKQVKVKADGIQASKQAKQSKAYVASRTYEADVPKGA